MDVYIDLLYFIHMGMAKIKIMNDILVSELIPLLLNSFIV
jgi:hypothetical protein